MNCYRFAFILLNMCKIVQDSLKSVDIGRNDWLDIIWLD